MMRVSKLRVGKVFDRRVKLTNEQRVLIKVLRGAGVKQSVLSRKFGVSQSRISAVSRSVDYVQSSKSKPYNRDVQKRHREYKRLLHKGGLI